MVRVRCGGGIRGRDAGSQVVTAAIEELRRRGSSVSPLLRHTGGRSRRAELPNFATEIYGLLALTELARLGLDPTALRRAVRLGDRLIELQRPDGGWPWLFHAERDTVVEPYEIYSVHQDAMAPMALLELTDVTGDDRYARPRSPDFDGAREQRARRGSARHAVGFAHRSIRRRAHFDRLDLAERALGAAIAHRALTWEVASSTRPAGRTTSAGSSRRGRDEHRSDPSDDADLVPSPSDTVRMFGVDIDA